MNDIIKGIFNNIERILEDVENYAGEDSIISEYAGEIKLELNVLQSKNTQLLEQVESLKSFEKTLQDEIVNLKRHNKRLLEKVGE